MKTRILKEMLIETNNLPNSMIIGDTKFELFTAQFLGKEAGFSAGLWQMKGRDKEHLFAIKYGKTEQEAKDNLKNYLIKTL